MTSDPLAVPPGAPLRSVVRLLLERKFNSVPVTSGGELLGMISRSDVMRSLAEA
jgi:CBS domain-containing protein